MVILGSPDLANKIWDQLGILKFNQAVVNIKKVFDWASTQTLKVDDFKNTFSGASDIVDGINEVQNTVIGIKDTIWDVRVTLSWAEDKINNAKQAYDDTVKFIDETSEKIDNAKKTLEDLNAVWETIKGAVNTDAVK